ncbi:MAG TPA: AtpZ/AtpI family protein [Planctomycetaceae bacterium]|nr:AtpZ/AtpI family protein [Planctomycetaceae bacterium]
MAPTPDQKQNPMAQGYVRASRASSIALTAVIPAALGYWADRSWNTYPWLVVTGAVFGFGLMMRELFSLVKPPARRASSRDDNVSPP